MGPIPHSKERILVKIKFECRAVLMSKHHDSLLLWYFTGRHWTDSVFVWTCILFFQLFDQCMIHIKGKKRSVQAIYGNPSHNCGVSLAVWDHIVLPSTRHKRTHPASTPAWLAGTRFTDHLRMEGWVSPCRPKFSRNRRVCSQTFGRPLLKKPSFVTNRAAENQTCNSLTMDGRMFESKLYDCD